MRIALFGQECPPKDEVTLGGSVQEIPVWLVKGSVPKEVEAAVRLHITFWFVVL